jgi:hypothetical protein
LHSLARSRLALARACKTVGELSAHPVAAKQAKENAALKAWTGRAITLPATAAYRACGAHICGMARRWHRSDAGM